MSLRYTDKKSIEKAVEVDKEDILDMLEDYPYAALVLALDNDCLESVFERFKSIVQSRRDSKRGIKKMPPTPLGNINPDG